ncbi:uncharacterized protein LOC125234850 [Leguminivora glycinivorella]|uniref:uncharacterized protein LOC125234850 n=1 Tax=Leguminivora glycinivorella TaxID=1035111 RepID=UPI00200BDDBE|nr:uncharacterized protein LOC125234850 [Leguminivora glycinivorella]
MHRSLILYLVFCCSLVHFSNACGKEYKPQVDEAVLMVRSLEITMKDLMAIIPNQIYNNGKLEHCLSRPRTLLMKLTNNQCSEEEEMLYENGGKGKRPWTVHPF